METSKLKQFLTTLKSTLSILLITVLSIGAIVYIIYQRNRVDTLNREIDALKRSRADTRLQQERTRRDIEELSLYPRIYELATTKLNMVPAKSLPYVIMVNDYHYNTELMAMETKLPKYNRFTKKTFKRAGLKPN